MEHAKFKADETAATYVAHGLDETAQEAFELHLMSCPQCVQDVEAWRAIEQHMPRVQPDTVARPAYRANRLTGWRIAASLAGVCVMGAAGGWFLRSTQDPQLDIAQTVFFNNPAITRGGLDCNAVHLAGDTRTAVVRVAGVASDQRVIAKNSDERELAANAYSARRQPDGSWILRFEASVLERSAIRLESQAAGGASEPLGCISGQRPAAP